MTRSRHSVHAIVETPQIAPPVGETHLEALAR